MTVLFDPGIARAQLEAGIAQAFSPAAHVTGSTHAAGDYALSGAIVYRANKSTTADPPNPDWDAEGKVYKVLYENIPDKIPPGGAVRISIGWAGSQRIAIRCSEGSWRRISGTLTCWVYTPANEGTQSGLAAIKRLRRRLIDWDFAGVDPANAPTTQNYVRVTDINGPRSSGPANGLDFFAHNLTATLTVIEVA